MSTDTRTFDLGAEFGRALATITRVGIDVVYHVNAPHVRGAFTLRPLTPLESEPGEGAEVIFGRDGALAAVHPAWDLLLARPVVHQVALCAGAKVRAHRLAEITDNPLLLRRAVAASDGSRAATGAVNRRASAAIGAITADYLSRPDLPELHHAHYVEAAKARIKGAERVISETEAAINRKVGELGQARHTLATLHRAAAGEQLPTWLRQSLARLPTR
ncbi:hypothetical protein [Nocardia asteroides]|uniref:hypothetical protein n=1 Tax=Nocardia asteroides TaxID=1824 RepID=UPI001E506A68|nr:hypothetical protein [Nocardia asteroides]UGT58851.1 hypothetical protein LTT85_33405 [Nocardia asteroides]